MLKVVVSLTIVILMTSGVIYDRNMFRVKATGVYLTVEHLKGASLRYALALLPNVRLGWNISRNLIQSLISKKHMFESCQGPIL